MSVPINFNGKCVSMSCKEVVFGECFCLKRLKMPFACIFTYMLWVKNRKYEYQNMC